MSYVETAFWSVAADELVRRLGTTQQGLRSEDARRRLERHGASRLRPKRRTDALTLLAGQFKSPIILILVFAAGLSFSLNDPADAVIILTIVLASGLLGFWQERGAADAVEKLLAIVTVHATVLREAAQRDMPVEEVVPGDVAVLSAGDSVPGDCLILESKDLFVDEATLTGETYPVEKSAGVLAAETSLARRTNSLWMGTHVVSGTAKVLVVRTGKQTEFGKVSERLKLRPAETEFEHGVRRFGYMLMEVTLVLLIGIFAVNVYRHQPVLASFMFALALAVGLTPQLLPAIISVNLAHGAKRMAAEKVIVKRLASIENFGSMNVLCSDKTGTLTEGVVRLHSVRDVEGNDSNKVLLLAYLNAFYETGFVNPIDRAIRERGGFDLAGYEKRDEVPYDFVRKRLSVLVAKEGRHLMVTKGALENVLAVCTRAEKSDGLVVELDAVREQVRRAFEELSGAGLRTLGVAYNDVGEAPRIAAESEAGMTLAGLVVLADPPKAGIVETLGRLGRLGVRAKMMTGDNRRVAAHVGEQVGLASGRVLTGADLRRMSDEALRKQVNEVDVFAEVEPNQKERIILALRKAGNVVGYMGDGINDASALHAADVGISVDNAVDVAKEAADIVLLEKDLSVLACGVQEGRTTFANTLKYVFMATSANFGNMFSMAGASLFLPFLPLLPKQILLTNLLTDLPEMTIATDTVDSELVEQPRRWDLGFIRKFMFTFGILSSVFDFVTFGVLLWIVGATPEQFRTGWFVESVVSASVIVLVVRSRRPLGRSMPGRQLLAATVGVVAATIALPYSPLAGLFGFVPLSAWVLAVLGVVVALYVGAAEAVKKMFYARLRS